MATNSATAQDNAALARRTYHLFNTGDFNGVLEGAADDVEIVLVPFGQTFRGLDGFTAFMQGFKTAFPDCTVNVTNQIATEDQVVSEFIVKGTHTGPLLTPAGEIPPTGRSIEYPACEVWRLKDGKLVSLHNYQDAATIMRQLGLIP